MPERSSSPSAPSRRVALIGGGTAGHVYPALAVAAAYRQVRPAVDVLFLGTRSGYESRLVPRQGYRLELVAGAPLFGVHLLGKARAAACVLAATAQAGRLFRRQRTELVLGFGGYTSAGPLLAARLLGIPCAVHEANVTPGLTNKWLGHLVDRVYLGFASAGHELPAVRRRVTGNPVRPEIAALYHEPRQPPQPSQRAARILITGGSQGARFFNREAPELMRRLAARQIEVEVHHQVGESDPAPVVAAYAGLGIVARVEPYFDDMADVYRWADFALARAGAATMAELAVAGLPALLVPLPSAADDHQTPNASTWADEAGGWWVRETEWRVETLAARLVALLRDSAGWTVASRRLRQWATVDAAARIVGECEALLTREAGNRTDRPDRPRSDRSDLP
jgi:UDP-N-acetylglucosamine--N-acetylmuramyl-(pentapeptide) pyrophosphoryl-undecaprenol N-acetylglucosamine transferase